MDPDTHDDPGPEGQAARRRLLGLLVAAATDAVAVPPGGTGRGPAGAAARDAARFLQRVCELSVTEVGVSGAGVTVMGSVVEGIAGHRDQVASSDGTSRRLEDLQLTAGQGPCLDAFAAGAPVLVADLDLDALRWPGFAPEALAAGAAAVFSFPLQVGAVRLGTLDLYRDTIGSLTRTQLGAAVVLAGLVTETLLDHTDGEGAATPQAGAGVAEPVESGWLADVHAQVHQASGMVAAAEHVGVGEALVRIRAYAYAHSLPIDDVAARIIARDLVLSDPAP